MKQSEIEVKERNLANIEYNTTSNNKIYIAMGKHDNNANECYTTYKSAEELVHFILNGSYIPRTAKIWLPFDCEDSNIYLAFKNYGFLNLKYSHLENGEDFYEMNTDCDYIISNPPFSTHINKKGIKKNRNTLFNRLFELEKPFIMLQPIQMLNNGTMMKHLTEKGNTLQFICPPNRMGFIVNSIEKGAPAFYSMWFTYKLNLPQTFNKI